MKVLIVSDVHGNYLNMKKVLENNPQFDIFLLLGDVLSGPDIEGYNPTKLAELLNEYSNKIFYVRGNCDVYNMELLDFFMDKDKMILPIDNHLFFFTHGHLYRPYDIIDDEFDVFLSGHTHIPTMDKEKNKYYLNPGSITLPKANSVKSYLFYDNGEFQLIDLDNNKIIKKISI